MNKLYTLLKYSILFLIGGVLYYLIETVYKGLTSGVGSHWTMAVLGGILVVVIGFINEYFSWEMPLWKQMTISTVLITIVEFISGVIINIWLGWDVWDYSDVPLNLMGQICLPFCIVWFFLSLVAIILDDYLRYWLFNEEKPRYKLF